MMLATLALLLSLFPQSFADTITVTAPRLSEPETSSRRVGQSLAASLQELPGIQSLETGGVTSILLRGAGSEHTLVIIDGIKVNDPLSPTRSFNFSEISPDEIETVEILRGPQSLIYGSDAMGGVIRITTKKPQTQSRTHLSAGFGTYRSWKSAFTTSTGNEISQSTFSGGLEGSRGFSSASSLSGNTEPDGNHLARFSFRNKWKPARQTESEMSLRYSDSRFENDFSGGPGGDDPDYTGRSQTLQTGLTLSSYHSESWEPSLRLGFARARRLVDKNPNIAHPNTIHSAFDSHRITGGLQNLFVLNSAHLVTAALEAEQETAGQTSDFPGAHHSTESLWAEHQYSAEPLLWSQGLRWDRNSGFGNHLTFRSAPAYRLAQSKTTLKLAISSGFKTPSLYQLFSTSGNPALSPEESFSLEAGATQPLDSDKTEISLTVFQMRMKQLIEYDFASEHYFNTGRARSQGAELSYSTQFTPAWKTALAYTFTHAINSDTGHPLLRRARHQGNIRTDFSPQDSIHCELGLHFTGAREDRDAISWTPKTLAGYSVFRFSLSHQAPQQIKLSAEIENLFNRAYEQVDGYGVSGRSIFVAVEKGF